MPPFAAVLETPCDIYIGKISACGTEWHPKAAGKINQNDHMRWIGPVWCLENKVETPITLRVGTSAPSASPVYLCKYISTHLSTSSVSFSTSIPTRKWKLSLISVGSTADKVSYIWKRHICRAQRRWSVVSVGTWVQTKGHKADQVSSGRLI